MSDGVYPYGGQEKAGERKDDEVTLLPEICHECGEKLVKGKKIIYLVGVTPIKMRVKLCPNRHQI
jgi:hypothetical protein